MGLLNKMLTYARRELKNVAQAFVEDSYTLDELEAEVEFWLSCEQCEQCNDQMCGYHFSWLTGR